MRVRYPNNWNEEEEGKRITSGRVTLPPSQPESHRMVDEHAFFGVTPEEVGDHRSQGDPPKRRAKLQQQGAIGGVVGFGKAERGGAASRTQGASSRFFSFLILQ